MNNQPLVAVMMPVYNGYNTLPLAIESLLNQTYTNWKCYIVNDGSTDGTKELLETIKDDRFNISHFKKNKGRPYARQAALDAAEGKYLAILDADDFYHPNKLKIQVEYLEKNPHISLLSSGMASFKNVKEGLITVRGNKCIENRLFKIGDKEEYVHAPSMLILEDAKRIKYCIKFKYGEDMEFLGRYLNGKYYASLDVVLYYYTEFESVKKIKVIKTYFFGLRKIRNSEMRVGLKIREYLKKMGRILVYIILYPVVSVDYFLKKRGMEATSEMKTEFETVVGQFAKLNQN